MKKSIALMLLISIVLTGCVSTYSGCLGPIRFHVHEGISETPNGVNFHKSIIVEH